MQGRKERGGGEVEKGRGKGREKGGEGQGGFGVRKKDGEAQKEGTRQGKIEGKSGRDRK